MNRSTITIQANGTPETIDAPCSVADFLAGRGFRPSQVVVERNGHVLHRSELARTMLEDGDRIEVVVPVAGG